MEANQYLNDFYNHYDEDSRLLFQHGSVEFLTTMRYIEKYLKHGDKVLEIGAGTGRYSHALARRGHPVDAVELVAHNIEVFRQNTRPGESVTIAQGNALDLSAFADNAYDVTLLLGPLYHLYTQDDKRRALREAIRVTKPGGVVFAAYVISDGCLPPRQYLCCRICAGRAAGRPDVCRQLPAKGFVRAGAQRGC